MSIAIITRLARENPECLPSFIAEARKEGFQEGFREGVEKTARNLLEMGTGREDVLEATGLIDFELDMLESKITDITEESPGPPELVPSFIKDARREGVERGREEGIEQGIERGREEVALRMLGRGMAPADVAALTGLPEKAVDGLRKKARPKSKA